MNNDSPNYQRIMPYLTIDKYFCQIECDVSNCSFQAREPPIFKGLVQYVFLPAKTHFINESETLANANNYQGINFRFCSCFTSTSKPWKSMDRTLANLRLRYSTAKLVPVFDFPITFFGRAVRRDETGTNQPW